MQDQIKDNMDRIDQLLNDNDKVPSLKAQPMRVTYVDVRTRKRTEDIPINSKSSTAYKVIDIENFKAPDFVVMEGKNKIFLRNYFIPSKGDAIGEVFLV